MSRYGTFKWGDGTKWGQVSSNDNLLWGIEVDWDGDGRFSGENESPRAVDLHVKRGRQHFLKPDGGLSSGKPFEHFPVGTAAITLRNDDGRYDSLLSSSPLYPNVAPGKYVKIRVRDGAGGTIYPVFAGRIADVKQMFDRGNRLTQLSCVDGWRWLIDNKTTIAVSQDVITSAAITSILSNVEYPSIWGTNVGLGADTIPYWWEDRRSARAAINELIDSELGQFFIARDGKATFRGRNFLDSSVHTFTQDLVHKDITYPQPWEVVRNVVRVVANPRQAISNVTVWTLNDSVRIPANDSVEFFADFRYEDRDVAGIDLLTPVATTDYTANSLEGGTGSDETSEVTAAIISTFSETAKLRFTNESNAAVWLQPTSKLRATAIDAPNSTTLEVDNSGTAQPLVMKLDNKNQQSVNQASNFATFLTQFLADVRIFPTMKIQHRPSLQFGLELLDRSTVNIAKLAVNTDFRIGYIEHKWMQPNGQAVMTTVRTEPFADFDDSWIFTTQMGVTSSFAY